MGSNMEPVTATRQKHDPAWQHCQVFKNDDKVHLKCIYCGKTFKGGGIYRFKEHLAGRKGNGVTCLSVHPDVRLQMAESLNVASVKKGKKPKLFVDMPTFDNPETTSCLNSPVPEMIEHDADVYNRQDGSSSKTGGKKKRGRPSKAPDVANSDLVRKAHDVVNSVLVRKAPDVVNSDVVSFQAMSSKKDINAVHMAVGRFFFDVGLSVDAVNSAYFQPMIDAIASQGLGAVGPSNHDLRGWILKNLVHEVRNEVDQSTSAWGRTGCSILVNECNSVKGKTFVNFFVHCPEGTMFLRSADISHAIDSPDALYELMKETIEKVGLRNVLQVITSSEERYVIAGKRLTDSYPTIFWTPCAGQCIDLMLDDIAKLPMVKMILDQAKSISRYIYSNSDVLNMMRRYTYGADIVDMGNSRASTNFTTLTRMVNMKHNLQSMITSNEWVESPYSKKAGGFAILDHICSQSFWSKCDYITRLTDPLLRLLRIIGSGKKPAMGFVYAGLYRAKEAIKKEIIRKEEYLVYWNIIDRRWEQLHRHSLHAAGFYFNPKFFYSLEGDAHLHIRSLVYDCIEKLVSDTNVQDKIMKEMVSYHGGAGDFGRNMAIRARDTLHPTEWWLTYGGGCPNLTRLAIRILSQTCCLIQRKQNKVPLEHMHESNNCLEHQRLSDLAFVQYNIAMKQMVSRNKHVEVVDPISFDHFDIFGDWVVDKEFCFDEGSGNVNWMAVDPPLGNNALLGEQIDDVEALGAGFDDYEIFGET